MLRREMRRHQDGDIAPDKVFQTVAEDALRRTVCRLDDPLLVNDNDAVGRRVDNRAEPRFALTQPVCRLLFIGDVAN